MIMEEIMTKCPRFNFCSVSICPLDSQSHLRNKLEGESKCKVAKAIRMRIGREHRLPKQGMTGKEFSFYQRWEKKTEAEKNQIKERLAENAFRS